MMRGSIAAALTAALLAGCAANAAPKKAPPIAINEDPYPSTYRPYPGVPTAISTIVSSAGELTSKSPRSDA